MVELPIHGKVAAGTPIEALRNPETIDVPSGLLGDGEYYALEVQGDGMVDAHILDGDTVVIEKCESAENGTIVVACIEHEILLARVRTRIDAIAFEFDNKMNETRIYPPGQVKIHGRLVGLLRRF